jgi:hypothetical protein
MPGHPGGTDYTNGQGRGTTGYRRRFFQKRKERQRWRKRGCPCARYKEILRLKAEAVLVDRQRIDQQCEVWVRSTYGKGLMPRDE